MAEPEFRAWLLSVAPRFPEFHELAECIARMGTWPSGHDETELGHALLCVGRRDLCTILGRAIRVFDLLCTPGAPIPDDKRLPWEWHNSSMVEQNLASMKRHSRERKVSTGEYRWRLGRRLAAQMARKTRILIDTCHWIRMRDAELGRPVPQEYHSILSNLRWLVATQRYICPMTPALFLELQNQTDLSTRLHTARLMEELSNNVILPELSEMEKIELRDRAFESGFGTGKLNTSWKVWTKPGFLLGEVWPEPESDWMGEEGLWYVQKGCIDSMWNAPLFQIIEILAGAPPMPRVNEGFAKIMNDDKESRPSGDFEQERIRALAMVMHKIIRPAMEELAPELQRAASRRPGYQFPTTSEPGEGGAPDPWCLPSVQITAGIEALIRTTNRKFKDNDMIDLLHCAAALPYCQVFFCDGPFEQIIRDPKLQYHRVYNVSVISSPARILEYLRSCC